MMNKVELLYPVENEYRNYASLNGMWYYTLENETCEGFEWGLPKNKILSLPCNLAEFFIHRHEKNYIGNIWLQKDIYIPKTYLGQEVYLRLDGIANSFSVYINGNIVVKDYSSNVACNIELTRQLHYGENNTIIIKVNNEFIDNILAQGITKNINGHKINLIDKDSTYNSGIIKSIHLFTIPQNHVLDCHVQTVSVTPEQAEINYQVAVQGNCLVIATMRNREGKVIATGVGGNAVLTIENPHLWSQGDGYLYSIDFEISRLGKQCDTYTMRFGIRSFSISDGELLLNNAPLKIKALTYKAIRKYMRSDVELSQIQKLLNLMIEHNYNCIYAQNEILSDEFLHLAELNGVIVINRLPLTSKKTCLRPAHPTSFATANIKLYDNAVDTSIMQRDKAYTCVLGWAYRLNEDLHKDDSDSETYAAMIDTKLKDSNKFSRKLIAEIDVFNDDFPEAILDEADIIMLYARSQNKCIISSEYLLDLYNEKILSWQKKYPQKLFLPLLEFEETEYLGKNILLNDTYNLFETKLSSLTCGYITNQAEL